ncbi:Kinetochore-associated protein DSN1-like [Holothuria leucospilota]|uniref:Kinetochore-associated protein DSN1-like n=1 Tax=Holothuria leucospilota TaxID=206669 RepID=A0A9Q1HAI4_HOLLE|nr:Kinetochore-associated protein DSN1-like [Holothuria leucospilota]
MEEGSRRLTRSASKRSGKAPDVPTPALSEKRRKSMPAKVVSEEVDPATTDHLLASLSKSAKSEPKRRRSNFVRGRSRKSIGTANTDVAEIHTKIPTDQPPEERLRLLKIACFEYTMNKLHEEFPILETIEDLRSKAKEEFDISLQKLVEDGTLKAACQRSSAKENPLNHEMETSITQLDAEISKLEEESKQWDEMTKSFSQKVEEASRPQTTETVKEPDSLSLEQRKLLSHLPDLDSFASWAGDSIEKVMLQIDEIGKMSKQVQSFQGSVDAYLSKKTEQLAQKSFEGLADIKDPKTLLVKSGN